MPSRSRSTAHSKISSSSSSSSSDEERITVASLHKRKESGKKTYRQRKKWVSFVIYFPRPDIVPFRPRDEYEVFQHFAHWYLWSAHAFIDYGGVLAYGIRWLAKQYGKMSRER